jgi:two-component system cell cycle sensor histidine kinase/response regulator CckA
VLTFARGVEGERTVLQISHLIREMQKITKETFPKNIDFKTKVAELPPIMGDATQIHQILLNLCVNARDAMPDGGGITISAKPVTLTEAEAKVMPIGAHAGNYVLLSVADTGTGIPPEIIDKIFEPFFTTKEIGKGTGLGLSTVITIIKSHGGFLDLKSEVGKGTSFNIYLPAAANVATATAASVSLEKLRGKGETILIADDELAILEMIQSVLINYGYKTVTAVNGADALALYEQYGEKVAAIIVDMMMPVMDGAATIKELKLRRPSLKCIALSGLMQDDKSKNLPGEAAIFLNKPFAAEKLLQTLHDLLSDSSSNLSKKTD